MQTFLPYSDFEECAQCLDSRRLNKQILEALIIYDIIIENRTAGAWVNHPIVKMWRDYPDALAMYYNECLYQWKEVRYRNHSYQPIEVDTGKGIMLPHWLEDRRLCASHRCNLLRKDFKFYSKYGWDENMIKYETVPYWWGDEIGYGKIPINEKKNIVVFSNVKILDDEIVDKYKPRKIVIKRKKKE